MRHRLFMTGLTALLALATAGSLAAQTTAAPALMPHREFVIVSGGPAMRTFEHDKQASHDKYWGNFADAGMFRISQLNAKLEPGERVTWLVYRPSYIQRGAEMNQDLLSAVIEKANKVNANLLWFDNTSQFINYLNRGMDRKTAPIALFEYFGHSNKACFLFDYSNEIDGMSVDYFHVNDLSKVDRRDFASSATSKSWGCHSGELFSTSWKSRFGIPMQGAIGKTDYSHGGLPFLSSEGGHWAQ